MLQGSSSQGVRIEVFWEAEGTWHRGAVSSYDGSDDTYGVAYDDDDYRWHDLKKLPWRTEDDEGCGEPGDRSAIELG